MKKPDANKFDSTERFTAPTKYFICILEFVLTCIICKYLTNTIENFNVGMLSVLTVLVALFYCRYDNKPKVLLFKLLYTILKSLKFLKQKFSILKRENFKLFLLLGLSFHFLINFYIIHKAYSYCYFMIPKNQQYYTFLNSIKRLVLMDPLIQGELGIQLPTSIFDPVTEKIVEK
jgi:hypothetical protein